MTEVILVKASVALVIATSIHIVTVIILTSKSNRYLKISTICAEIAIQVQKRYQVEADVTKIRLARIELTRNQKLDVEEMSKLDYREKECSCTIKETQNEINKLQEKLNKLKGKK